MRRYVAHLSLMVVVLVALGCREQPGQRPTDPTTTAILKGSDASPLFYTPHWAIENNWVPALESIDTQTGLGTSMCLFDIAPDPEYPDAFFTPYGLAFDLDGTAYTIVSWFDGVQEHSKARFARVDMATCALTYIGEPYSINMAGPEIDACGNVYATGFTVGDPATGQIPPFVWGDSYLYRIDKHTGEATRVGDTGYTRWMDMAVDSHGRLWATFDNDLYTLDTQTGASTFVTHVTGVPQSDIPGVCPEDWPYMEIMSIAFDEKDVLWATAMRGFSYCDQIDAPVMRVDIQMGAATVVGYTHQGYNHGGDIPPVHVKVCHRKGNGAYVPITIELTSLPDHRAHGDIVPGVDSSDCNCPGTDGDNERVQ